MKHILIFTFILLFTTACGKDESPFQAKFSHIDNSEMLERIETTIPEGIEITKISEIKQGVILSGRANNAKLVNIFVHGISQKKIDTPNLKSIKSGDNNKHLFELEVIQYPVKN